MSRTATLRQQIEALGIDETDLVERIVQQADQILTASQTFVEQGQEVQMCFFIIPRDGDIKMFMPSVSMVGLPKMSPEDEKEVIGSAIRQLASESRAIAVIQVAEAWGLSGAMSDLTQDDIEFVQRNGVRAHPKAIEMVHCAVNLNCRGQGHSFAAAYQIEGELPGPRTMTDHMDWMHGDKSTGRMAVEAMYLQPLT